MCLTTANGRTALASPHLPSPPSLSPPHNLISDNSQVPGQDLIIAISIKITFVSFFSPLKGLLEAEVKNMFLLEDLIRSGRWRGWYLFLLEDFTKYIRF